MEEGVCIIEGDFSPPVPGDSPKEAVKNLFLQNDRFYKRYIKAGKAKR
jgi:hypothetical protein